MGDFDAEFWDARYGADGYIFGTAPNAWLQDHAGALPAGGRVLCVADGEGRNSVWLAAQGFAVEAFDISPVGVEKARALAAQQGADVAFTVAGVDEYAWPQGELGGVAAIFVQFADPAMRARMFARMSAALRPGGTLLLIGYTPKQLDYGTGGPRVLEHLYTEELLRDAFPELDIVELEAFEADIDEGPGHRGRSALIGLVARKPGP